MNVPDPLARRRELLKTAKPVDERLLLELVVRLELAGYLPLGSTNTLTELRTLAAVARET